MPKLEGRKGEGGQMKPFEVSIVETGADAEYIQPTVEQDGKVVPVGPEQQLLHHFTKITVTLRDGFTWTQHGEGLMKAVRRATEVNEGEQ